MRLGCVSYSHEWPAVLNWRLARARRLKLKSSGKTGRVLPVLGKRAVQRDGWRRRAWGREIRIQPVSTCYPSQCPGSGTKATVSRSTRRQDCDNSESQGTAGYRVRINCRVLRASAPKACQGKHWKLVPANGGALSLAGGRHRLALPDPANQR